MYMYIIMMKIFSIQTRLNPTRRDATHTTHHTTHHTMGDASLSLADLCSIWCVHP